MILYVGKFWFLCVLKNISIFNLIFGKTWQSPATNIPFIWRKQDMDTFMIYTSGTAQSTFHHIVPALQFFIFSFMFKIKSVKVKAGHHFLGISRASWCRLIIGEIWCKTWIRRLFDMKKENISVFLNLLALLMLEMLDEIWRKGAAWWDREKKMEEGGGSGWVVFYILKVTSISYYK